MNPSLISKALHDLADVLSQLAKSIETSTDNINTSKEIGRLSEVIENLKLVNPETENLKYKKGFLRKWLTNHQISMVKAEESLESDVFLIQAASYLAQNYQHLGEFLQRLKQGQSLKRNFTFRSGKTALPYILSWCEFLKKHHLIDNTIDKSSEVFVDIAEVATATSFITGNWLEIVLRNTLSNVLKANSELVDTYDFLSQIHIVKDDGKISELDLLLMLNEKVYWFECKSGEIGDYYKLFLKHKNRMGLDYETSIVVIPNPNIGITANLKSKNDMQTFYATDLEEQLVNLLF
jgi:hypothetical protein